MTQDSTPDNALPRTVLPKNDESLQQRISPSNSSDTNIDSQYLVYLHELETLYTEMILYIYQNKKASVSLMSNGDPLAEFLIEYIDPETLELLLFVALMNSSYCYDSSEHRYECAQVAAQLNRYKIELENLHKKMIDLDNLIIKKSGGTFSDIADDEHPYEYNDYGALEQGPKFHPVHNQGAYRHKDNEIRLSFNIFDLSEMPIDLQNQSGLEQLIKDIDSQLHQLTEEYLYTLLTTNTLLVLKHDTTYIEHVKYSGIGIELEKETHQPAYIKNTLNPGPAFEAGLQAGDKIIAIDGVKTASLTLPETIERLKGKAGSYVLLDVKKSNSTKERKATDFEEILLTRERNHYEIPHRAYGYVAIYQNPDDKLYALYSGDSKWTLLPEDFSLQKIWKIWGSKITIKLESPILQESDILKKIDYKFEIEDEHE